MGSTVVESDQITASADPLLYVHAGDVLTVTEPTRIVTILGSCVSVCLYDPEADVAGINHYLFPASPPGNTTDRNRFGDVAISQLVGGLLARGAVQARLRAKVFGGSDPENGVTWQGEQAGSRNVAVALAKLGELGIPVINKDVGGVQGRRVEFHTRNGSVYVKRI
jgi:chemotaxis protein CheD